MTDALRPRHPARGIPVDQLREDIEREVQLGNIALSDAPALGLTLACYTKQCVYERAWNPTTLMARGLIFDYERGTLVATPFPKFFNLGEGGAGGGASIPALPFEVWDKLDGSLIIIFYHQGSWRTATKGAFASRQALSAQAMLEANPRKGALVQGATYLAELIGPGNRIVVRYPRDELLLLGGYFEDGTEMESEVLAVTAEALGWSRPTRFEYPDFSTMLRMVSALSARAEGVVLRFADGLRLKVKGDEYCRIHRLVSDLTPLGIWRAMLEGDDLEAKRQLLPEEFWGDWDAIVKILDDTLNDYLGRLRRLSLEVALLSDKELGLRIKEFPPDLAKQIFNYRKQALWILNNERSRRAIFATFRPTGNALPGYTPGSALHSLQEDPDA